MGGRVGREEGKSTKMKKKELEDPFPVSVIVLDRADIEAAVCLLDKDVQKVLRDITWDAELLGEIAYNLHLELKDYYFDEVLLPQGIKAVLKCKIEEVEKKRKFLSGLSAFIKGKRGKK